MTIGGKLIALFPVLVMVMALSSLVAFVRDTQLVWLAAFFFVLYLFPPLAFRIHNFFWPLVPGSTTDIQKLTYSPWWASYQFQSIYIAVASLESLLRLIPGAYSAWLRLWGSKIGKQVVWTPRIQILDRNLMDVGDRCVFGYGFACSGHVIDRRDGKQVLYINWVKLGHQVFAGAETVIGPGCKVEDGVRIPARSTLKIDEICTRESQAKAKKTADQSPKT